MVEVLGLAAATLVSEDLACTAAGLMIQRGQIGALAGVIACTLGIFLGDCGLWAIGRIGARAAGLWLDAARRFPSDRLDSFRRRLERNAGRTIIASRFIPGTRLPLYLAAGALRMSGSRFAMWTLVAACLWTPAVVLATAGFGAATGARSTSNWRALIAGAAVLLLLRAGRTVASPTVQIRITARLARWRRWEFWPMWLFYPPIALWIAWLAIRYRGLRTMTAANPGIADGGVVGESKVEILNRLPPEWTIPATLLGQGTLEDRVRLALDAMTLHGWRFPVILKPDVGQRGVGVRLIHDADGLAMYFVREPQAVILQPYHEGPYEAGVFYYRFPGWTTGRIFSITDKYFPSITGDGRSTVGQLVWAHPRYRMQARLFLERHEAVADRVLAAGETFRLAIAGNHAQGTMFRNGRHLITPALERRIDAIARSYPGFYVGRFDIRYRDVEAFMAGRDLAIVELNGATAESTDIYDPDASLWNAYAQLCRQWSIVFAIGAANRARGEQVSSTRRLLALVRAHLASTSAFAISD